MFKNIIYVNCSTDCCGIDCYTYNLVDSEFETLFTTTKNGLSTTIGGYQMAQKACVGAVAILEEYKKRDLNIPRNMVLYYKWVMLRSHRTLKQIVNDSLAFDLANNLKQANGFYAEHLKHLCRGII